MKKGSLYLFPTPISDETNVLEVLPSINLEILKNVKFFVVENIRTARRFISKCKLGIEIDSLNFIELSEHTNLQEVESMLKPLLDGNDIILMSEAGVPAVADPGSELVRIAHINDIEVKPLVGPSSIIMALMCSGSNGQSFVFHGYIPVKPEERKRKVDSMVKSVVANNQTQIFIETPYRNIKLMEFLIGAVPPNIKITIASGITAPTSFIKTKSARDWKIYKGDLPINKVPTIFILG